MKITKNNIYWIGASFIFPPLGIVLFGYSLYHGFKLVINSARKHSPPMGTDYYLWILLLLFLTGIFNPPISLNKLISTTLNDSHFSFLYLIGELTALSLTLFTILMTVGPNRQSYLPRGFINWSFSSIGIGVFCLIPLLVLLTDPGHKPNMTHPLITATISCYKQSNLVGLIVGFLSICILGPLLEELVFRGLLLHRAPAEGPKRWWLNVGVSFYFALLHYPVSFIGPFILSLYFIKLRDRTGGLIMGILLHIIWNSSRFITAIVLSSNS